MADNDKLTTDDIAEQKPAAREGNGEMTRQAANQDTATRDTATPDTSNAAAKPGDVDKGDDGEVALFDDREASDLRQRWTDIQSTFVDRPKDSVSQADELVAQTIQQLAKGFADERGDLEEVWSRGGDVSTEDLRLALQRYRSFFERLLNA